MAKRKKPKKVNVKSKAYAHHERAPRGTHKEATINDALLGYSQLTKSVNKLCKTIKDSFDPFRKNLKETTFWSRLISLFKKQLGTSETIDWRAFREFPFVVKQKLHSVLSHRGSVRVENAKRLTIMITSGISPYKKNRKCDTYRQTLVGLFLTKTYKPTVFSDVKIFPATEGYKNEQTFECPIPRSADIVILALKCELCKKDEVLFPMEMRGMEIIWSDKIAAMTHHVLEDNVDDWKVNRPSDR